MATSGSPLRVALLGGGMGSLAAAWELTNRPDAARYAITVYERGWRLGGKAASGRNRQAGDRIEEHGLHVLMGYYRDTFRVLRTCCDDLAGVTTPHGVVLPWGDAMRGWDAATFAEPLPDGKWDFWRVRFPSNARPIGTDERAPSLRELIERGLAWLLGLYRGLNALLPRPIDYLTDGLERAMRLLRRTGTALRTAFCDAVAAALEGLLHATWAVVAGLVEGRRRVRHLWTVLAFGGTNLVGLLREGALLPGFDFETLDRWDYKHWLATHARRLRCPARLSWDSPPVNAMYDLAFSRSVTFAAGTMVRNALDLALNYRGHIAYKLQGGMGDVVFAPLYLALRRRGVRFRFFHRVTGLRPRDGRLEAIDLEEQVEGPEAYDPLMSVHGLPCWPSEPNAEQLAPRYRDDRTAGRPAFDFEGTGGSPYARPVSSLRAGRDFDVAVLGIPVGALAPICGDLMAARPAFAAMVREVRTMPTQAMQLWLTRTPEELGWDDPGAMVISYEVPFNSWVDMSHLLPSERWPAPGPRQLAYFCDALPDPPAAGAEDLVRRNALARLETKSARLWPGAACPAPFDWSALYDPLERVGPARLEAQYWRANLDPSSRFVLSVADSTRWRLPPDGSGFVNLALAGDWVRTDLSAGCLEAATRAGLEAGRSIADGRIHS